MPAKLGIIRKIVLNSAAESKQDLNVNNAKTNCHNERRFRPCKDDFVNFSLLKYGANQHTTLAAMVKRIFVIRKGLNG